jgi:hypothetical protein
VTLTLWRGEHLLGELLMRAPSERVRPPSPDKPPSLSAFLVPAPDAVALEGVWQIAFPPEVGIGVQQCGVEPDIVAERKQRWATRVTNPGPVALEPMSSGAVAGVPRDVQLTIRASDGAVYLPRQLRLEEVRYEPALYDNALREVPPEAFINGSVWCAFIAFASDAEAPAT